MFIPDTLQQHLPFTVLKLSVVCYASRICHRSVATALTVYGIETLNLLPMINRLRVATALTVYGIETQYFHHQRLMNLWVATALTVYGIET